MKKLIASIISVFLLQTVVFAQDEGAIVKRERIQRDKSIFLGGGISILGGANVGDYANGINFEGGFMKRLNRVLSLGASFSYQRFKYDPSVINSAPTTGDYPSNFFYSYDNNTGSGAGYLIDFNGPNLTLLSLNGNIKVNFVPIKDNTVISVYGFAKPFITMAKHADINANADYWTASGGVWSYDSNVTDTFSGERKFTGGIFVGPGIEINPSKPVSFFAQASFGYTFPMDIISTKSFPRDISSVSNIDSFPFVSDGFTSVNFAAGISFNID